MTDVGVSPLTVAKTGDISSESANAEIAAQDVEGVALDALAVAEPVA